MCVSSLRSENQKAMFRFLAEKGTWIEEKNVYEALSLSAQTGRACLKVLTEKKLLLTMEETKYMLPFDSAQEENVDCAQVPVLTEEQKEALSSIVSLYEIFSITFTLFMLSNHVILKHNSIIIR